VARGQWLVISDQRQQPGGVTDPVESLVCALGIRIGHFRGRLATPVFHAKPGD